MQQFDSYIKLIVKNLNISSAQKEEMEDEFRDHLEMLKKDYIAQGNTEEAAVDMAIEKFGDNALLGKKLSISTNNYRSIPNIAFGMTYLIFLVIGFKVFITLSKGQFLMAAMSHFCLQMVILVSVAIVMLSPIGYFLPIIFRRIDRINQIVFIYCLLDCMDIAYGSYLVYNHYILGGSILLFIVVSITGFISLIISGMFGYKLLNFVDNSLSTV